MTNNPLRYADDRDKVYGLAGMTITLVALDGEHYLSSIDIDARPGEELGMSRDFSFKGNPRMSAKIVWEQTLRDLRLAASMTLGNIVCRRCVLAHSRLTPADTDGVRMALRYDADEHCGLDADEADRLFDSCRRYVERVFSHPGLSDVAHNFAGHLARRRNLSGAEALEILSALGLK